MGDPVTGDPVAEARAQGYSNAEIAGHLAGKLGADSSKVQEALDNGYTYKEISDHLAGTPGVDPTRPAQAIFDHLASDITFRLGNKALAAVQSIHAGHGLSDYQANLDRTNHDLDAEFKAHPYLSALGSVGGALLNPANEVLAGLGVVKGAAAAGALGGAGAAHDDPKSLLSGAAVGAAGGGLLGKGGQLLGSAVHAMVNAPSAAASRLAQAVTEDGGAAAVKARMAALGPDAMLLDGGPSLLNLGDHVSTVNPTSRAVIKDATDARQAGMAQRALSSIRGAVGNPEAEQLTNQAKKSLYEWADGPQGYGGLRDKYAALPLTPDFHSDVLRAPGAVQALDKVNLALKGAGKSDPNDELISSMLSGVSLDKAKSLGLTQLLPAGSAENMSSYGAISQLRRVLDHKAEAAFTGNPANPELGQAYKTLRNGVDDYLENTVGEHKAVSEKYGVLKDAMKAVNVGANDWATLEDPRLVASKMASMPPEVLANYRKGVASGVIKTLLRADPMSDIASPMTVKAGEAKQKLLQTIFPDEATFKSFMDQMGAERTMAQARSATTGSQSGSRVSDLLTNMAGGGALMSALTHPHAAMAIGAGVLAKKGAAAAMRNRAGALGPLLVGGPDAIEQLLMNGAQPSLLGHVAGNATVGAAGGAGGLLGSFLQQ